MDATRRLLTASRLAWLLVLALWLPVAQVQAATHLLVHLQQAAPDGHPPGWAACDVAAASLQAVAPPAVLPPPAPALLPQAQPVLAATGLVAAGALLGYRSRAPPASR